MDSHEFTPALCISKWLLATGPVSFFPCPSTSQVDFEEAWEQVPQGV